MEDQQLFQTKKESGAKRHYDRNLGSIILLVIAVVFIVFHTTILTFSNSYINAESEITTYFLGIMCLMTAIHSFLSIDTTKKIRNNTLATIQWKALSLPILIIFSSRVHFILVKGHGQDPSLRVHLAHSRFVFLTSLLILAFIRTRMMSVQIKKSSVFSCKQQKQLHLTTDSLTLVFLAYSWWEKRSIDPSRNGFISCTIAIFLIFFGLLLMVFGYHERMQKAQQMSSKRRRKNEGEENFHVLILFKVMLFTITVTGPSAASSAIIFIFQSWALQNLSDVMKETKLSGIMLASLWRLTIRQSFFSTGHACSLNRLQTSAAFVATDKFSFGPAGISLFFNTFGWDILGTIQLVLNAECNVWNWYYFFQMLETTVSCISVSIMRRHLMVWAIFAPRFVFAVIFIFICMISHLIGIGIKK